MFTTNLSQANCRKVFIQRDFSEGSWVRFATRFPVELEGKMDRQLSDFTIIPHNRLYAGEGKGSTYCEGCMDCLTAKMGLLLTDPVERGLRVVESPLQTESAPWSGDTKQTA